MNRKNILFWGNYTSRGHVFGFYGNAILFGSKARKQAHSKLCNCFRNAATGQKSALKNRKCGRAKYITDIEPFLFSIVDNGFSNIADREVVLFA